MSRKFYYVCDECKVQAPAVKDATEDCTYAPPRAWLALYSVEGGEAIGHLCSDCNPLLRPAKTSNPPSEAW